MAGTLNIRSYLNIEQGALLLLMYDKSHESVLQLKKLQPVGFFLHGLFHNHQIAMLVCLSPTSKIEEDFFFIPAMKRMCSDFMFRFITIY